MITLDHDFVVDVQHYVQAGVVDPYQRLVPGARLTIGKRISNRVYLTFSRSLTSSTDPVIWMMEYDATDRLSLVLSRNEDNTYALDVRVRHVF